MSLLLPAGLRDLAPWFEQIEVDVSNRLAALLPPLQQFLGPPSPQLSAVGQEPAGLDNLLRKGSYERLVLSEWLLAEEHPDEFLRRAAQAEHLFLRHRMESPKAQRQMVVLFDTGLLMLGAARLVQAALFILLARRAQRAQAELWHGCVQAPPALSRATDANALRALLAARTTQPADTACRQQWDHVLSKQCSALERWWVGPASGPTDWLQSWASHRLELSPSWGEAIRASVEDRQGRRELELNVARDAISARLLQGDWMRTAAAVQTRTVAASTSLLPLRPQIHISHDARELVVTTRTRGMLLKFRLSKKKRPSPQTARWRTHQQDGPDALSASGRTMIAWYMRERDIQVLGLDRPLLLPREPQEIAWSPGQARLLQSAMLVQNQARLLLLRDRKGKLHGWELKARNVTAPIRDLSPEFRGIVHSLEQPEDHFAVMLVEIANTLMLQIRSAHASRPAAVLSGWSGKPERCLASYRPTRGSWHASVAIRAGDEARAPLDQWLVWTGALNQPVLADPQTFRLRRDLEVIGVLPLEPRGNASGLLVILPNRQDLCLIAGDQQHTIIYRNQVPISSASLSVDGLVLALADHGSALTVLRCGEQEGWTEVLRYV